MGGAPIAISIALRIQAVLCVSIVLAQLAPWRILGSRVAAGVGDTNEIVLVKIKDATSTPRMVPTLSFAVAFERE